MHKKSQAAMEFLTTYGWAILVVMVAISALAYFGVMNPAKTLPQRCIFSTEFTCKDFQINKTSVIGLPPPVSTVSILITNNLGKSVTVNSIAGTYGSNGCTNAGGSMSADESKIFVCAFSNVVFSQVNDKVKLNMSITYTLSGGSYTHTVNGEIYGAVQ